MNNDMINRKYIKRKQQTILLDPPRIRFVVLALLATLFLARTVY